MLAIFSFSFVFIAIFYLSFGVVLTLRGRHQKDNRLFILLMFTVAFWAFSCWRFHAIPASGSVEKAFLWARILAVSSTYVSLLIIHWVVTFLGLGRVAIKYMVLASYIFVGIITVVAFSPFATFFVAGVQAKIFFPFWPVRGHLYTIYIFYMYGGLGTYATYLLFLRYHQISKNHEERQQVLLVFAGLAMSLISGATNFLLWFDIPIPPFGNFLVPAVVFFYGYAIIKHHLFNVKAIATEFITFLIWIFLFFRVVVATTPQARLIDSLFLILTIIFGLFLISSVNQEVKQKEQLAYLNTKLEDLNLHLEDKVKEQTKEIRRAYEVEKKARHDLEELDKAKTDFILTTQHHLRTPLTVIKGVANMFEDKQEGYSLSKTDTAFLGKLSTGANKLAKLINDFLDISQMEVGKSILNKEKTCIHPLIDEIISEVSHEIEQKQLHIETSYTEEAKDTPILLDKKRFLDAITNLIDNAVKYTPKEGRITIHGEIAIHPIEKTQWYQLTIKDTGIGMTEEEKQKIFTRSFERGSMAKEMNATGRGIGLLLTKQIIEAHGGTIHAESGGRDKGSVFVVEVLVG